MTEHPEGYASSVSIGQAAKAIEDGGHEVTVRFDEGIWSAVVDGKSISWTRSGVQLEADLRRWWEENRA